MWDIPRPCRFEKRPCLEMNAKRSYFLSRLFCHKWIQTIVNVTQVVATDTSLVICIIYISKCGSFLNDCVLLWMDESQLICQFPNSVSLLVTSTVVSFNFMTLKKIWWFPLCAWLWLPAQVCGLSSPLASLWVLSHTGACIVGWQEPLPWSYPSDSSVPLFRLLNILSRALSLHIALRIACSRPLLHLARWNLRLHIWNWTT